MRVKTGTIRRKRHKKIIKLAKGYRMTRSRLFRVAHEAVLHAGEYAYAGRKKRKRDLKRLWIVRINAAARKHGLSYSKFMAGLKSAKIRINHKILAHLAVSEPKIFETIVKKANKSNSKKTKDA